MPGAPPQLCTGTHLTYQGGGASAQALPHPASRACPLGCTTGGAHPPCQPCLHKIGVLHYATHITPPLPRGRTGAFEPPQKCWHPIVVQTTHSLASFNTHRRGVSCFCVARKWPSGLCHCQLMTPLTTRTVPLSTNDVNYKTRIVSLSTDDDVI